MSILNLNLIYRNDILIFISNLSIYSLFLIKAKYKLVISITKYIINQFFFEYDFLAIQKEFY